MLLLLGLVALGPSLLSCGFATHGFLVGLLLELFALILGSTATRISAC